MQAQIEGRETFVFLLQKLRSGDPMVDPKTAIWGPTMGSAVLPLYSEKTKVFSSFLPAQGGELLFLLKSDNNALFHP